MAPSNATQHHALSDSRGGQAIEPEAGAIVSVLNRHEVQYVVIGAFAAIAQKAPIAATRDIDFTPNDSRANLGRLSAALKELDARVRTDSLGERLPFDHSAASLRRAAIWNLICPHGEFDITFHPSGFEGGYSELVTRSHRVVVAGVELRVADLDDVIQSKEAAGRPKDLQVLPALYRHRQASEAERRRD